MASSSCTAPPTHTLADRNRVISELTRGRDIADQLRLMLHESPADRRGAASELPAQINLVGRIMDTFTHSLSMLLAPGADSDEVLPEVVNSVALKSEDSGDSCKTPATKDRRGCYKRRKTTESWTNDTTAMVDDGHAWRKYGQKTILHSKYPRNYYRCTHKFDQGCHASKQVQQIQEEPPLFRTTYLGRHTCNTLLKSPHRIIIDPPAQDSSVIWSFQPHDGPAHKAENKFVLDSSHVQAGIKQEKEEDYNNSVMKPSSLLSDRDFYMSSELTSVVFDASNDHHLGGFSSGSDHGDVISCTASTHSTVDMDLMVGSDFDDFLDHEFGSLS